MSITQNDGDTSGGEQRLGRVSDSRRRVERNVHIYYYGSCQARISAVILPRTAHYILCHE